MWYFYDGDDEMEFEEEEDPDPDPDPDPLTHNFIFHLQQKWKAQYQPYDNQRWLPQHPFDLQPMTLLNSPKSTLPKSSSSPTASGSAPKVYPPYSFEELQSLSPPTNPERPASVLPLLRGRGESIDLLSDPPPSRPRLLALHPRTKCDAPRSCQQKAKVLFPLCQRHRYHAEVLLFH